MKRTDGAEALEDFDLAFARLDWARASAAAHLPSQREALQWHLACCEAGGRDHAGIPK